jgi:hypothetical protein
MSKDNDSNKRNLNKPGTLGEGPADYRGDC